MIVGAQLPSFGVKLLSDLKRYFNEGRVFQLPEIDTTLISSLFSLQVLYWTWLIPFGKVASYMEIAKWMGNPKATRAVGGALKRNPLAIIIPCHRVIGSNGKLTGFAGGIELKRKLLELEGSIGEITY
ncbi:MAG: methylated-DNA--[protein]-cysteine S-methyltransferase [Candidatus Marinimicrobia bacterium]|nr:methylated-DNA--[protein]-cysteine S-methyltransferase [Candidatus Neomarinimicrobiota bacterium]